MSWLEKAVVKEGKQNGKQQQPATLWSDRELHSTKVIDSEGSNTITLALLVLVALLDLAFT